MDNNFLLTYDVMMDDYKIHSCYAWFETEDELNEFIEDHKNDTCFSINEAIEIRDCHNLK